jgi:carotenoid cleavage dioxygenase
VSESGNFKVGEYNMATRQVESYYGIKNEDGHASMAHDLMFTTNHFVLYDNSAHFDPIAMFEGKFFNWKPEHNLRIGLAPRHQANATGDDVVWFDVGSPQIMIHPLNAWEEDDGTVVLWAPIGDYFDISLDKGNNVYYMVEYRMNPNTGETTKTIIDKEWNIEFPRIRPDFIGQFGRFGTATIMEPKLGGDGLFKGFVIYDMLEKKPHKTVLYREGDVGGEAVVIPKPGTFKSHEFYVGTMIRNVKEEKSYFVLYDGETGGLTARVELPHRVPSGLHCEWLSEEQLRRHVDYHAGLKKQQTMTTVSKY